MGLKFAPWWVILLDGILAIIIGILLATKPVASLIALVYLIGWYWLVTGIMGVFLAFTDKNDRILKAIFGIIGILAGLAIIEHPVLSGIFGISMLIMIVGIMSICMGAIGLFQALKGDWGAAAIGLLNVIFGIVILGSPLIALVTLAWLLGFLSIIVGIAAVVIAFKLR